MRASTKAATIATTLNPQPIWLKSHTPRPSQIPKLSPVSPMGIETKEPNAQGAVTLFSSHQVVVTEELATHSTAATQEPNTKGAATSFYLNRVAITQEPTTHSVVVTQEPATHSTTETQELATDFVPAMQE